MARVERLVGPELPEDRGLTALGLIMQLGGGVGVGLVGFIVYILVVNGAHGPVLGVEPGPALLVCVLGLARSCLHRTAGASIVYGTSGGRPFRLTYVYVAVAFAHTVLTFLVVRRYHAPGELALTVASVMAAWPFALLVLLRTAWVRRFAAGIPRSSDKGYEGLGVLMLGGGIAGMICWGATAIQLLFGGGCFRRRLPSASWAIGVLGGLRLTSAGRARCPVSSR